MNHNFTVEEINLISIFAGEKRAGVIEAISSALPYLEDSDMEELSHRVIAKLRDMTDREFEGTKFVGAEL